MVDENKIEYHRKYKLHFILLFYTLLKHFVRNYLIELKNINLVLLNSVFLTKQ